MIVKVLASGVAAVAIGAVAAGMTPVAVASPDSDQQGSDQQGEVIELTPVSTPPGEWKFVPPEEDPEAYGVKP